MTASELRPDTAGPMSRLAPVSPSRLLASALLHVLDRDEPLPARWRADPFVVTVAYHRSLLQAVDTPGELDRLAPLWARVSFPDAVTALASDPLAAALAVRRLEMMRGAGLPAWPDIVRHGVAPRVGPAEAGRWFG